MVGRFVTQVTKGYNDPVLRSPTQKVKTIDREIRALVAEMERVLTELGAIGIGISANQIGVPRRVSIIKLRGMENTLVLINPEFLRRRGERHVREGCLSVPGWEGKVVRAKIVKVKALNLQGEEFRIKERDNLMAQCLEHELDHLDGILYFEKLVDREMWEVK